MPVTISSSRSHRSAQDIVGIILYKIPPDLVGIILLYIHQVDGIGIRAKMNYDYKVAGAEDLISVLVRGIEEGTCGNH